jgi:MFS family permease
MVAASPVAGAVAGRIDPRTLMLAGCAAIAAGLGGLALAPPLGWIVAALLAQGFGQGLFMVAFLDVVTATLPPGSRGVAGSLGMLTRALGVVLGASLLTLAFRSLSGLGIGAAFEGSFGIAAGIAAACVVLVGIGRRG